jgi:hypothetical protein
MTAKKAIHKKKYSRNGITALTTSMTRIVISPNLEVLYIRLRVLSII